MDGSLVAPAPKLEACLCYGNEKTDLIFLKDLMHSSPSVVLVQVPNTCHTLLPLVEIGSRIMQNDE